MILSYHLAAADASGFGMVASRLRHRLDHGACLLYAGRRLCSALLVELEQPRQNLIICQQPGPPVITPAICFRHGLIQRGVGVCQPLRAGVVKVSKGSLFQFLFRRFVLGEDAVGIAWHDFRLSHNKIGGVEPAGDPQKPVSFGRL